MLAVLGGTGVSLGYTVQAGHVVQGQNPLVLPRQIVYPGMSLEQFAELVTGAQ